VSKHRHLSPDQLQAGLEAIRQSPTDTAVVKAIVIRPQENQRVTLQECHVSPEQGVHGDR